MHDGLCLSVLLIEEHPGDRQLIQDALALQWPPVRVDTRPNGRTGLERLHVAAAAGSLSDVLLLDLQLPDLDGFDLLTLIRRDPDLYALPVVILTGSGSPEDLRRAHTSRTSRNLVKAPGPPGHE